MERPAGELVEWLGRAESGSDGLGGKAASLDRMGRLGFRIPPGFCLTTAAFRAQLASIPGAAGAAGGAALATMVTEARFAAAIEAALWPALREIDAGALQRSGHAARLAVRSSAIGEDSSAASYAGLHETELDRSVDEVPDAIKRCWASLWSPPALAYRTRRGLPLDGAAMAVVVQELVPADAAAVAFTRHPVTGRTDQLVVTAIRGLGEAMVSGTVTPDTYVIDRATHQVVEFSPGDDVERPLDSSALEALVELVLAVEASYGAAVDVEAAMSAGTWFLLQARPITTHAPVSA